MATIDYYCCWFDFGDVMAKHGIWSLTAWFHLWAVPFTYCASGASLVAQMVKNLSSIQETWIRSLGQEDPLEKGMDTHSSILAWRIPCTEEAGRLQFMRSQRVQCN